MLKKTNVGGVAVLAKWKFFYVPPLCDVVVAAPKRSARFCYDPS